MLWMCVASLRERSVAMLQELGWSSWAQGEERPAKPWALCVSCGRHFGLTLAIVICSDILICIPYTYVILIYIYRLYCDILCILRYIMRCETGSFHFFSHRPGIETCSVTGFFPCTNEPNFCVMVLPTVGVSRWFAKEGIAVMAGRPANICTSAFSSSYLQVPTSDAPIVSTPTNRSLELFRQESHSTANSAHASATCTWASGILAYQKCCRRNAKLDQGQENDLSSWPGLHEEIHCMLAVHVAMSPNTSTKLFHEVIYRYL